MQADITIRQVVEAATAFALVFVFQSLYAWRGLIKSLFGFVNEDRETWLFFPDPLQCGFSVAWFFVGLTLATLFGLARAGRLAHEWELFLAWESVSILAAEAFQVTVNSPFDLVETDTPQLTVVVYPLYSKLVVNWSWLIIFLLIMMMIHIALISLGLWQLTQHRLEVLWAAPAAVHFTTSILALMCLFGLRHGFHLGKLTFLRLACWVMVSFVAFSLSVVGAVRRWDSLHLIQCILCMIAGLEPVPWKWCRRWWRGENVLSFRCRGSQGGICQQTAA